MHRDLIEQYAVGGPKLSAAIAGLTDQNLRALPSSGGWTIAQIVQHLMDADLIASDRMKRVIAEPFVPTLIGFDESAFAANLFYNDLDAHIAADIFEKNRQLTAHILRSCPDATFERVGNHNERGAMTLTTLLQYMVNHLDHHLKYINEKRRLLETVAV